MDCLRELETSLPSGYAGVKECELACRIIVGELEQIILNNLPVVRALADDFSSGKTLPELERQALIERLQPYVEKVAARIDADRRWEVADAKRRQVETQRRRDEKLAREQADEELANEAALARAHVALGWSSEEATLRRELSELENADST